MSSISTSTFDSNGTQRLLSDTVLDIRFVDVSQSTFANPDDSFTGYSADGFWYTAGQPDPSVTQDFKATWAAEGEGEGDENRGTMDRFPDRLFVVTTDAEVALIDADTLDLWMRFVPFGAVTAGTYGAFLGDTATEILTADFSNGFLLVGTSQGLRIADFRADRGLVYTDGAAWRSESYIDSVNGGLVNRNEDEFVDFSDITATAGSPGDPHKQLTDATCLSVSISAESGVTIAAVGHTFGLSGIVLHSSTVSDPNVKEHVDVASGSGFLIQRGSWTAKDDNDGDGETPQLSDGGASDWEASLGVRIGDVVVTDLPSQHVITDITDNDVLTLDPELDITDFGSAYDIFRPVSFVRVEAGGVLYLANGMQKLGRVGTSDWYEPSGDGDPIDAFDALESVSLLRLVTDVSSLSVTGSLVYASTDIGIFKATVDDFGSDAPSAEYLYSAGGTGAEATYEILEGGFAATTAVVVDPETGHIMVAGSDDVDSVLTEIDVSLNQAFQSFDYTGTVVNTLVAYRNLEGPPDTEVE